MKKIIICLLCLLCLTVTAAAVEMEFEGELTAGEYGTPGVVQDLPSDMVQMDRVSITGGISYDKNRELYCYTVDGFREEIAATVMTGMITTDSVSIYVPNEMDAVLYHDGAVWTDPLTTIGEVGNYALIVTRGGAETRLLTFAIVGNLAGDLSGYRMPDNFAVTGLRWNDAEIDYSSTLVDFTDEGDYAVTYRCVPTQRIYTLRVTIDHTPPVLILDGVADGVAHGPVTLSCEEENVTARVLLDGEEIKESSTLSQTGRYDVTVTDAAGNSRTYTFRIALYFNTSSLVFFALLVVSVIAVVIFLYVDKKRVRVR